MRQILFDMVRKLQRDTCYQCDKPILTLEEFSIEHKTPWLHASNAAELYFDLDNIAFSHRSCNYGAARSARKVELKDDGTHWCGGCQAYKPESDFFPSYITYPIFRCRECHSK